MSDAELAAAIDAIVAETGAASIKDMGRVMAALKERHAGQMDMGKAGAAVRGKLGKLPSPSFRETRTRSETQRTPATASAKAKLPMRSGPTCCAVRMSRLLYGHTEIWRSVAQHHRVFQTCWTTAPAVSWCGAKVSDREEALTAEYWSAAGRGRRRKR
jgi:hypothetical protein